MNRATSALLVAAVVSLPIGWILVFASGYGGNSTDGSELVWRVGGVMVYAAMPILLAIVLLSVVAVVRAVATRRGRSA